MWTIDCKELYETLMCKVWEWTHPNECRHCKRK